MLTVFRIDRTRSRAAVEALLGPDFRGVVGSDRWSAYNRFPAGRRVLCYAHLKRDFQGLIDRGREADRKSTRLNSSHANISYAVFCLKKKQTHFRQHL